MKTYAVVAALILALSGCSSAPKKGHGASTATLPSPIVTTSNDSLGASTRRLKQDFSQTQADLGKLESEIKIPK